MDIYELVRRYHDGASISKISERLSLARKTVRRYLRKAEEAGISWEDPLPEREKLLDLLRPLLPDPSRARPAQKQFEDHWPELRELVTRDEDPLKPKSAFGIVEQKYGLTASYSSFKRFWRSKREELGEADPALTCRFEVDPGEEVQIDYGKMGLIYDPIEKRNRTVFAFIATLSHSRLTFVELTYSQDQKSFVGSNIRMVEFFGGVPRRVVPDSLKSGVIRPDRYDPELNPLYQDFADHYDCFVDPADPGEPTQKGKVERAVPTVREQFRVLKEQHPDLTLRTANQQFQEWCRQKNGLTVHGTTKEKPLLAFEERERAALRPLPGGRLRMADYKQVTVHADQYVQFEKGRYSVPSEHVGKTLWARGLEKIVEIYTENHELVKIHPRATRAHQTDPADFPEPVRKVLQAPEELVEEAGSIGGAAAEYVKILTRPGGHRNRRKAQAILRAAERASPEAVEAACAEALRLEATRHEDFQRLLVRQQSGQKGPEEEVPLSDETAAFVRQPGYFIHD